PRAPRTARGAVDRPRPRGARRGAREALARAAPALGRRRRAPDGRQVARARDVPGARHRLAADLAPRRAPGRSALSGAREGAPGVRLAPHLPRPRPRRARLLPPLYAA